MKEVLKKMNILSRFISFLKRLIAGLAGKNSSIDTAEDVPRISSEAEADTDTSVTAEMVEADSKLEAEADTSISAEMAEADVEPETDTDPPVEHEKTPVPEPVIEDEHIPEAEDHAPGYRRRKTRYDETETDTEVPVVKERAEKIFSFQTKMLLDPNIPGVFMELPELEMENEKPASEPPICVVNIDRFRTEIDVEYRERKDGRETIRFPSARYRIEEPFRHCAVEFPVDIGIHAASIDSYQRNIYLFRDDAEGMGTFWPCHGVGTTARNIAPGFYWALIKAGYGMEGLRIDFEDNRTIWNGYELKRFEIRDEDLVVTNETGSVVMRLEIEQVMSLCGDIIRDDDDENPILCSEPGIKAPAGTKGPLDVWYRPARSNETEKAVWNPENDRILRLDESFSLVEGLNQIDIMDRGGSNTRLHFRWFPFLAEIQYPRGIILPGPKGHTPKALHLHIDDPDVDVSLSAGDFIHSTNGGWKFSIKPGTEKTIVDFHRKGELVGQAVCVFKRFVWNIAGLEGGDISTETPVEIERSALDYSKHLAVEFPQWLGCLKCVCSVRLDTKDRTIMEDSPRIVREDCTVDLRKYYDTIFRSHYAIRMVLTVRTETGEFEQELVRIPSAKVECQICGLLMPAEEIDRHLLENHSETFFDHLSYDEIREKYKPELPEKIYICHICGYIARPDFPGDNLTTKMEHHFTECHRGLFEFAVCEDVEEIREKYEKNLPMVYRCRICGEELLVSKDTRLGSLSDHASHHEIELKNYQKGK